MLNYNNHFHVQGARPTAVFRIIGFEMQIELLEGKFKLGQERGDADKQAILKNLQSVKPARSIYEFTAEFYKRG
jgi:predicted FMN-binding regulatory protein PaiB